MSPVSKPPGADGPAGSSPGFVRERIERELDTQQRMRALPYGDRLELISSYIARNATAIHATPYCARSYAPARWRNYAERGNIVAGFATRHMAAGDSCLPYNLHQTSTVTANAFPAFERYEHASRARSERFASGTLRALMAAPSQRSPLSAQAALELDDEPRDRREFTHYLEEHVRVSSIVPLPSKSPSLPVHTKSLAKPSP